ncbi:adult-specific rigid cuticular protein 15.7 [Caerostris extrusa]|uniref:Adult-specific rigid cuticular protein 15.7 n=1 Tax=Caerostris extrusa TaxID=172846 RepID=A0AAV4X3P5_CAEEX|nr:adult-specific rigid cuticular protein 15.7 [Caerostris extrusa]
MAFPRPSPRGPARPRPSFPIPSPEKSGSNSERSSSDHSCQLTRRRHIKANAILNSESDSEESSTIMFTKVAFLCAALAAVHASGIIGAPLINTGVSASSRQQDETATATGRDPTPSPTSTVGPERVDYVADGHGFRATVKTNEPGTAASAPAAALINSPYAGPVVPVVNHVALAAPAVAAPLAVAAPALAYGGIAAPALAYGGIAAPALAYSGLAAPAIAARAIAAPVAYGGVIGHGAALGLRYGAGILGAGIGKY